jgi:hypothetical protein
VILQPLLVALVLGAGRGQAPAPRPWASYRAVATLDEPARLLRGTVEIVVRNAGAGVLTGLGLRRRTATVLRLRANPGDAVVEAGDGSGWSFPQALAAGDSVVLQVEFTAADLGPPDPPGSRPAGPDRRFDFHAWLPTVVQGVEAVSVVGSFLVRLDLPVDQVVAATGVPLCGDPGWAAARWLPGRSVTLRGDTTYAAPRDPTARSVGPGACVASAPERKTLVWYAEDVRDVALTMDPAFRYEEGDVYEHPVRGLFAPGSERTWGAGSAVRHTETALAWLHELFEGPRLPWPQTTVVHGHPGSPGRVDPMLVAPDSNDRDDIVRQVGRLYLASAIAVVPADSAWLDEGLARFQSDLYAETQGRRWTYPRLERSVLEQELQDQGGPVVPRPGTAPARDRARRAEFLFYQLRWAAGDSALRAVLISYWARARFGLARESLFVAVVDSVTGGDLGRRFAAALREDSPVDYSLGATRTVRLPQGFWRTTVEIRHWGSGQFPVTVRVDAEGDTASARVSGLGRRDTIVIVTGTHPRGVVLDPDGRSHDWDFLNNRRSLGLHLGSAMNAEDHLGGYFSTPGPRDRLARAWAPVAWYNEAGGWTVGLRRRDDYLGRFDLNTFVLTLATGEGPAGAHREVDWHFVMRNPTALRVPGLGEGIQAGFVEGRLLAGADVWWTRGARTASLALDIVGARSSAYLDSALYERGTTYELGLRGSTGAGQPGKRVTTGLSLTGGYAVRTAPAPDLLAREPYARVIAQATGERTLGPVQVRARAWGGAAFAQGVVPRQRRVYFAGADPYELLNNPFVRSRGALFLRPGFHYHAPGGAGLRALEPTLGGHQAYALSLEVERDLVRRGGGLARRVGAAAFGDGALGDGDLDPTGRDRLRSAGDGGLGLRIDHRIGATTFQTRLDLPVWVSAPALAQDRAPGQRRLGWRWTCSLAPAF